MDYNQKFIPEGWNEVNKVFSLDELNMASINGNIIEAKVTKCDSNYNLYVDLGNNITGIIPREEVEAVNIDETGFPKPNICTSKINKFVQFKVKDTSKKDAVILSRRAVGREAMSWMKNDLKEYNLKKWNKYKSIMKETHIPNWYVNSLEKIVYMFPKAHSCNNTILLVTLYIFSISILFFPLPANFPICTSLWDT